jgi:hypothetical protein
LLTNPFPTKNQLLQACRSDEHDPHPILRYAHELSALQERRLCADRDGMSEIDDDRTRVVEQIDRWVLLEIPPAHGSASIHTETMGAVIDRLAQYTARAYMVLAGNAAGDRELWDIWERLAELAVAYEDLSSEVAAGRRRLPGGH